jgi:DeoR/GlpR family transcriptional regulator of sugar metabolism
VLPRERLEIIKQIVTKEKKVYVSRLSEKFEVTEETIRRDLEKLEIEGMVTRSYGGAILNREKTNEDVPFYKRSKTNLDSKQNIANKAINFIKDRSTTIIADSSSTVLEVLKIVKDRSDVTVITNSVEALEILNQADLNILSTGGVLNKMSLSLQGSIAKTSIQNYNVDIALISCKGVDINKGILDSNEAEAELKRVMIKQANKVILLIDHTKFDRKSFVKLFDYKDIDYLITDEEPTKEWVDFLHSYNVEIIY